MKLFKSEKTIKEYVKKWKSHKHVNRETLVVMDLLQKTISKTASGPKHDTIGTSEMRSMISDVFSAYCDILNVTHQEVIRKFMEKSK